jgi:hypothetical protein
MLNDGLSLAALIDALLRSPLKNQDAVKLITRALSSGDFHRHTGLWFSFASQIFL